MANGKKIAGYSVLALALAGSITISAVSLSYSADQYHQLDEYIRDQKEQQAKENEQVSSYQENGYKVSQYEIRSTENISDAYLSKDESGLNEQEKETLKLAEAVLDEVVKEGASDYEKELAIFNWMRDHISIDNGSTIVLPSDSTDKFTPLGVLKGKQAVCVGYATTFRMLMHMIGLECHVVHNEYHSWNEVKLDDGEWYMVDLYSDVAGAKYRYFNLTSQLLRQQGSEWDESSLPIAKGVKYSFANQNAVKLDDIRKLPAEIAKQVQDEETVTQKGSGRYFNIGKDIDEAKQRDIQTMVSYMTTAISMQLESEFSVQMYQAEDGGYILGSFIINYGSEPGVEQEDEKLKKLVEDAFGVDIDAMEFDGLDEEGAVG